MRKLLGAVVLGGVVCASTAAQAAEPATLNSLQLGLGFKYGSSLNDEEGRNTKWWGPGLGIDAGYTLPMAIYVGGRLEYFFGSSVSFGTEESKVNVWDLMAEGGYDIGLAQALVLRPNVDAGVAMLRNKLCSNGSCDSDTSSSFALAPGVKALLVLPKLSLSAEFRYEVLFANDSKALIFGLGVGAPRIPPRAVHGTP